MSFVELEDTSLGNTDGAVDSGSQHGQGVWPLGYDLTIRTIRPETHLADYDFSIVVLYFLLDFPFEKAMLTIFSLING